MEAYCHISDIPFCYLWTVYGHLPVYPDPALGDLGQIVPWPVLDDEYVREEAHSNRVDVIECCCCCDNFSFDAVLSCTANGDRHHFCFTCVKTYAETQIGLMKSDIGCFVFGGCGAVFDSDDLRGVLGLSTMNRLEKLKQDHEVRHAALEGLEECPFCGFKAICPDLDMYREFPCQNPVCRKMSCRLCREETHIPQTCEEFTKSKNENISAGHLLEEALTTALIVSCPDPTCRLPIEKNGGCNKLCCVRCGCVICSVCRQDISLLGYAHFGDSPRCPLFDVF